MVLGSINGVNGANADTWVGIGTTAPASTLDVEATAPGSSVPLSYSRTKPPSRPALAIPSISASLSMAAAVSAIPMLSSG